MNSTEHPVLRAEWPVMYARPGLLQRFGTGLETSFISQPPLKHHINLICLMSDSSMWHAERGGFRVRVPQAAMVRAGEKSHKSIRALLRALSAQKTPRILGQGAFGVVKAVKLSGNDEDCVAVKTLKSNASPSEAVCFQREKEILQKLEHE